MVCHHVRIFEACVCVLPYTRPCLCMYICLHAFTHCCIRLHHNYVQCPCLIITSHRRLGVPDQSIKLIVTSATQQHVSNPALEYTNIA